MRTGSLIIRYTQAGSIGGREMINCTHTIAKRGEEGGNNVHEIKGLGEV